MLWEAKQAPRISLVGFTEHSKNAYQRSVLITSKTLDKPRKPKPTTDIGKEIHLEVKIRFVRQGS